MKCFYHRDADAIGLCKSCEKGVCAICAVDVGNGLACQNQCEERVRCINELTERSIQSAAISGHLIHNQPRGHFVNGAFTILAGTLFVILGMDLPNGVPRFGFTGLGLLLVISGIWLLETSRRLKNIDTPKESSTNDANELLLPTKHSRSEADLR